jgi:LacI family transcriptional regulator
MRRKLITIRDVAEHAGVSVSTVSHVLNGNDHHVGVVKRERVLAAVDALGYRPNAIARSMVKRKTATVGLVWTEIDNPIFIPVITGIEEILRPANYHIVLASAPDVENEIQAIETLRSQQVDGFIFMSLSICYPFDHLVRLKNEGVPLVVINRCLDDSDIPLVQWDDRGAGYQATQHLLSLGHTRIGTISGPIHDTPPRRSAIERHRGWQEALQEYGITVPPEWTLIGDYTHEGGYKAVQRLLALRESGCELPGALFVANDVMAAGTLKALHDAKLEIPRDMSVVTVGDTPFAAYTIPALTTQSLPVQEAGREAAHILLEWLTHGRSSGAQNITLKCRPQIRESCSPLHSFNS